MIRGKQENTVGAVEDRHVVQEKEEEEEMKMENMEETENMEGNESNENVSSGAISGNGEISGNGASPQKRTTNIAQAGSIGVANDRKQALTLQLAARGLIETISTRATNIYNSMNINTIPSPTS
jgi:hypothetical protein